MDSIPIIDLKDYVMLVQKVSRACEELGMFQVINHGVPQDFCKKVMAALLQFFTEDHSEQDKIFNHYLKRDDQNKVTTWRETFSHPWHPTQDFTHLLPKYPPKYRYYISNKPVPGALVIILPDQMQVLTNGMYKSAVHSVVTNKCLPRVSLAMYYATNDETVISPIENLINEEHPPKYRSYRYKEFMEEFYRQEGQRRRVKETFEI